MNLVRRDNSSPFETKLRFRVARQGLPCLVVVSNLIRRVELNGFKGRATVLLISK